MVLMLYNTLTRKKEDFIPLKLNEVKMYSCGPTVYNYPHIGNYRAFMCSDILKRYLSYKGYNVTQVMNITDVDDKTIRDSKKEKKSLKEFTEFYTFAFLEDMKALNLLAPDIMPKATEYIDEMVKLVQKLLEKGYAYKANDGIYFKLSSFKEYGKLSHIDLSQTKKGSRVSKDEYDKTNPNDFALWKFWEKEDGDVFWETKIGKGRPGWHIECSAMSMKLLGKSFDIHTGGVDLIFPHHENEIAQSEAATGKKFVNYWMHNEYILVEGKKMSKSLGNFYTLRDLLAKGYDAKSIRYLLLSTHYRQQLNFTLEGLEASKHAIERIKELVDKLKRKAGEEDTAAKKKNHDKTITRLVENTKIGFEEAMDDDLNISQALAMFFEFITEINKIMDSLSPKDAEIILGFLTHIDKVLGVMTFEVEEIPEEIVKLAKKRQEARNNKNYAESDKLRDLMKKKGYYVDDAASGYVIKKIA
ncbi:cysteine--tRNA ligase [Candidatus Woesearchaeota archaeon]|nr:cysteine--tRNA ligase [Candidatus Woesearchaeota archaeon]